jgi:hypothetical protein
MTENSDNVKSYNFLFTIDSIFLSGNILDAKNKIWNCHLFMIQSNSSRHTFTLQDTLQPSLHMSQKSRTKQEYKFQWQLPLHNTLLILTSTYTDPNKTSILWEGLITYDILNPQGQIVMDTLSCETSIMGL